MHGSTHVRMATKPVVILSLAAIWRASSSLSVPADGTYTTGRFWSLAIWHETSFSCSVSFSAHPPNCFSRICLCQSSALHSLHKSDVANHAYPDQRHLFGHHRRGYRSSPDVGTRLTGIRLRTVFGARTVSTTNPFRTAKTATARLQRHTGWTAAIDWIFLWPTRSLWRSKPSRPCFPSTKLNCSAISSLADGKLGLVINFHAPLLREGIKRVVLGLEEVPKSTTSKA